MPGCQGGRRFSSLGVGCGFAIWGPFRVRASDACTRSTRCGDGRQVARRQPPRQPDRVEVPSMCWACGSLDSRWCQTSGGEIRLSVTVHDLEMLPEGVRSQSEERMVYLIRMYDQNGNLIPNRQGKWYKCMCQNGQDELPCAPGSTRMRAQTECLSGKLFVGWAQPPLSRFLFPAFRQ